MKNTLLYTDDNIIGHSIHDYMIDNKKNITTLNFQDIVKGTSAPSTTTIIVNTIHKDISAATTVYPAQASYALRFAGFNCKK